MKEKQGKKSTAIRAKKQVQQNERKKSDSNKEKGLNMAWAEMDRSVNPKTHGIKEKRQKKEKWSKRTPH